MTDLVVLAAGMGSRFGGVKQLEPVGPSGETVMDYAVFDAVRAGVERVVFVIRRELEEAFHASIGSRYAGRVSVAYAFQALDALPGGRLVPEGRTKPWGTGQAVLAAGDVVDDPFIVINADDFYGRHAYADLGAWLAPERAPGSYAMVAFGMRNTLSEHGAVSRGVCQVVDGRLRSVVEHTGLAADGDGVLDASGARFTGDEPVSLNFWGLQPDVFGHLEAQFGEFLDGLEDDSSTGSWNPSTGSGNPSTGSGNPSTGSGNPSTGSGNPSTGSGNDSTGSGDRSLSLSKGLKAELYLPAVIDRLVSEGVATVDVLTSPDPWFGMTYAADQAAVSARLAELVAHGDYDSPLVWRA